MAKTRKKKDKSQQEILGSGKGGSGGAAVSHRVPDGPPIEEKLYNGLDISALTEKIVEFAERHGASYHPINWNGTARISMVTSDSERLAAFFSGMEELRREYRFNVSVSGCLWGSDSRNAIMNGDGDLKLDFVVPAKVGSGFVS